MSFILNSPAFVGTPTAPTAAVSTNTTQLATTAFVLGQLATLAPVMNGVAAVGVALLGARQDHVHASDTSRAALANPNFTGVPTAPTAAVNTNTTQLATCAFVMGQGYLTAAPVTSVFGRTGAVVMASADVTTALGYTPINPSLIGAANGVAGLDATGKVPVAQLPASVIGGMNYQGTWNAATNIPALASGTGTKGWYYKVATAGSTTLDTNSQWNVGDCVTFDGVTWDKIDGDSTEVVSVAGRVGVVVLAVADVSGAAPLASPALTGAPTAPTAGANMNTTQLATTAFVVGQAATVAPVMDGTATVGVSLLYARQDHVHATNTVLAPLASPGFSGIPTAPTATGGTNTTQLATTAFVAAAISTLAPLAGPAFTGVPTAPTAVALTNTTQLATTAFVQQALSTVAVLNSPAFTGVPTAPTAAMGTNTTQLATCAFVQAAAASPLYSNSVKTTAYTVLLSDNVILANASGAGFTITLPAAPSSGQNVTIKKIDASANAVTIAGNGFTIDGAASVNIGYQYNTLDLVYANAVWNII